MIVADANPIAYLLIPGPFTADAERVLKKDPEWLAPMLWRSEFASILIKYVRAGTLTSRVRKSTSRRRRICLETESSQAITSRRCGLRRLPGARPAIASTLPAPSPPECLW